MRRYLFFLLCLTLADTALASQSIDQLQQLIAQQKYLDAAERGAQMLQQEGENAELKFLTAYAHQMSNNPDKAASLYRELIQQAPQLPEPRNNLAMIYLARGDYDRASELLIAAINTHRSYAIAYDNLSRVYKGIASEAYRRAVSESAEPASYTHDIRLTAIAGLDSIANAGAPVPVIAAVTQPSQSTTAISNSTNDGTLINAANLNTLMIESVRNWALAWRNKNFDRYIDSYQSSYRSRFNTREQWIEHRRGRILRPGELSVEVSDFKVRQRSATRVSVDFTQAFRSPGYSDRVIKRLDFERQGATWKIAAERVLSVL